jgi:HD superfamily phosphohydrolase
MTHEIRARNIITKGKFSKLISDLWEVKPEDVALVISGQKLGSEPDILLANSFIDSAVDVDKVDYLVRDSIHCGVDYGRGIDVERLFDSLYVDIDKTRLCIIDKGLTPLLSLFTCRNIMYQAVYWHKTVRACEAMFKRFFYEFVDSDRISQRTLEDYFKLSDDAFTMALYDACKGDEMLHGLMAPFVFKGRMIYKPVYIFNEGQPGDEPANTEDFFVHGVIDSNYHDRVNISNQLAKILKKEIKDLNSLEILLEVTPKKEQHTRYDLKKLRVWHSRKKKYRTLPSEIIEVNNYLDKNRQAYMFCHPRHYQRLADMAIDGKLDKIFGQINY